MHPPDVGKRNVKLHLPGDLDLLLYEPPQPSPRG